MPIQRFAGSGDPFSLSVSTTLDGNAPKSLNAMRAWACLRSFGAIFHEAQKALVFLRFLP